MSEGSPTGEALVPDVVVARVYNGVEAAMLVDALESGGVVVETQAEQNVDMERDSLGRRLTCSRTMTSARSATNTRQILRTPKPQQRNGHP